MSLFLIILLLFAGLSPVHTLDMPISQISDDSLLRIRLKDSWFSDTPDRVLARRTVIEQLPSGERVEVRSVEGRDEFMVILSRELLRGRLATETNSAMPRSGTGQFPGWAQGSWMLTRNKDTGAGILIRIFLRSDQYTYIQFRPFNDERSQMDIVLYGGYLIRSMPIAASFERIYTMQLNDIIKLAGAKFPIEYFEPDPQYYRNSRRFVEQVRRHIGDLNFADDGAIDEHERYVFIETLQPQTSASPGLNCSGFVKWLIDSILRPVTGQLLPITQIKAPFGGRGSSFTENWESRDPYFGLDWIRNLASEANKTLRSPSIYALEEFEVRSDKFSLVENRNFDILNYPGFLPEAGYGTEGLYPLLYTLAVENPFSFYLAAINNEIGAPITPENPRGGPRLRQYYHVAALIPYFDEYGVFRVVVFESAAETSFNAFRSRYPGHYINLVQIPVSANFNP
jgi:hypothetical protein